MKHYKKSCFNIEIEQENSYYLWNTLNGNMMRLSTNALEYYHHLPNVFEFSDNTIFSKLIQHRYIVPEQYNEVQFILSKEQQSIQAELAESFYITVATTLSCNYNCIYCFEKDVISSQKMSKETQDHTIAYILSLLSKNKICKKFRITWFGGEPLLFPEIIDYISRPIIEYCDANNIEYGATVITNGVKLTDDTLSLLLKNRVDKAQITIDGMPKLYCRNKQCKIEDFNTVIENIKNACNKLLISVRINVDTENTQEVYELTDYLLATCNLNEKIKIYLAQIRTYSHDCPETANNKRFLLFNEEFIHKSKAKYGYASITNKRPIRSNSFCKLASYMGGCVGPNGELYRCEHNIGLPNRIVGDVITGYYYNNPDADFLNFQHKKKCLSCRIFPICLGGCKNDIINGTTSIDCDTYIEVSKRRILEYTLSKLPKS